MTNPTHCLSLVLTNLPNFTPIDQAKLLSMGHAERIEETMNSFDDASRVRIIWDRIRTEIDPRFKAPKTSCRWKITKLTNNIIDSLCINDEDEGSGG